MPGIEISALPPAASAQLSDVFPADQLPGPVTRKIELSQLLALFQSSLVESVEGTANQVFVNGSFGTPQTGVLTLTLPQDIATTSNVTFGTLEFSTITIAGETPMLYDSYGNVLLSAKSAGPTAVNYLSIINNSAGQPIGISALGADPDIGISIGPKGLGALGINSGALTNPLIIYNGTGSQHQTNFIFANTANARSVTFQDSNGTVAWLSDVANTVTSLTGTANQVLVNATSGTPQTGALTLTLPQDIATTSSPEFDDLTLTGGNIIDANGNINLGLGASPSAVNYIVFANNSTGLPPFAVSVGADSDIGMSFSSKGDAGFGLNTSAVLAPALQIRSGTSSQHATNFLFANTSATRWVTFQDSDGTVAYLSDITGSVNAGTANQIAYYATTGTTISGLTSNNNSVLVTNGSGVPSTSTTLPSGLTIPTPIINGFTDASTAAAGVVGQVIKSSFVSQSLTSGAPANITSIALTAGDWDIWANVSTLPNISTVQSVFYAMISLTSGTAVTPTTEETSGFYGNGTTVAGVTLGGSTGVLSVSINSTTTYYLNANAAFSVSTLSAQGIIFARRRR